MVASAGTIAQHFKAPGVAPYNFVTICYFLAGIRIYDISRTHRPKEVVYFYPGHRHGVIKQHVRDGRLLRTEPARPADLPAERYFSTSNKRLILTIRLRPAPAGSTSPKPRVSL